MGLYDYEVKNGEGQPVSMKEYEGKVLLIVNSATACGFTPQYEDLQGLYEKFNDKGLEILDFPCNQFGNQAPGSQKEIQSFCELEYGVTYPVFEKVDVNGNGALPLYDFLKEEKGFKGFDLDHPLTPVLDGMLSAADPEYKTDPSIKWNFTKFLVDRSGTILERFEPTTSVKLIEQRLEGIL